MTKNLDSEFCKLSPLIDKTLTLTKSISKRPHIQRKVTVKFNILKRSYINLKCYYNLIIAYNSSFSRKLVMLSFYFPGYKYSRGGVRYDGIRYLPSFWRWYGDLNKKWTVFDISVTQRWRENTISDRKYYGDGISTKIWLRYYGNYRKNQR